jgi:hypothetical protein
MAADARFDFFEKVIVSSTNPAHREINIELGAVSGRACGEDGCWSYAVSIDRTGLCWSCMEGDFNRPACSIGERPSTTARQSGSVNRANCWSRILRIAPAAKYKSDLPTRWLAWVE